MIEKGVISMSVNETERLRTLQRVDAGSLKLKDAAQILNLSYRQTKRIWKNYCTWGCYGLTHKSRGMNGNHYIDNKIRTKVLNIYKEFYWDFGPTLASEKMLEEHGIEVNRETLRLWLIKSCLWPGRDMNKKHRKRRPRKEHFGEMIQFDGSKHNWFEDRGKGTCLMVMIDDATGKSLGYMDDQETTKAAIATLKKWLLKYGVPQSLYTDRKNIYITDREPSEREKREGTGPLTNFGRICARMGIKIIAAHSPQAKGRVERHNRVLQDRFVKELRLHNINTINGANAIIDDFMDKISQRFSLSPLKEANFHRHWAPDQDLDFLLRIERSHVLKNDWTFEDKTIVYQIKSQFKRIQPRSRLTICEMLNGDIKVIYGGVDIPYQKIGHRNTVYKK